MSVSPSLAQKETHPALKIALRLRSATYLIAAGLFAIALLSYILTLAPSVVALFDDSLEFQLVTYQLGIAHPTGYPLYTLLGKLFTLLPIGNVAYRVNLMSAVFGAGAVALLYLLILRLMLLRKEATQTLTGEMSLISFWVKQAGAVIGALLFSVGLIFWQQATVAEVYTLNAFFVVALLYAASHLSPQDTDRRKLMGLAFLAGLALTHHRTSLLLLPALAVYLLLIYGRRIFDLRTGLFMLLAGLLPLLLYLYLPWRGHVGSLDGTYENNWAGFWRQVSASGYGSFIFDNPFDQERDFAFYWNLLADQFYTTVPGFIGLVYLFRTGRYKILALTGIPFLTYFTFNIFYKVADIAVFFIPVFLIWAVWSGMGATFLLGTTATLNYKQWRLPVTSLFLAVFIFMIFQLFRGNRLVLAQSYSWRIHDYGIDILQQPFPPAEKPAIVGILGEMTLIRYFQQTENRRPDLETVAADLEADRLAAVENLLAEGKSVYLTRELPGAPERWSLSAVGPLIRVRPEPVTTPPEFLLGVNQEVTPEITLLGYTPSRLPHTGQGPAGVRLTLFWQVNQKPTAGLKVSARLLNQAGAVQAVVDAEPVHFTYPTLAWRSGEIISDVYDLFLPADNPPGQYTPFIIWYDPAQNAGEVGRIELSPITID
jgi:hypothetical protein